MNQETTDDKEEMVVTSISIPRTVMKEFDETWKGKCANRSAAISEAIRNWLRMVKEGKA